MVVAAVIVTVGSVAATVYSADKSASTVKDAAGTAAQVQREALAQQKELAKPYTQLGKDAIPTLEALLGIGSQKPMDYATWAKENAVQQPTGGRGPHDNGAEAANRAAYDKYVAGFKATDSPQKMLESLPGYQFAKTEGLDATKASAASMGLALSGNTLEGLDRFSTGLADQTYGEQVNRLTAIAQLGESAASGQAVSVGNNASNLSNIAMDRGSSLASIYANEGAGIASAIGGGIGLARQKSVATKLNPNSGGGGI